MRKLKLLYCPSCELDFGTDQLRNLNEIRCPSCNNQQIVNTERTVNYRPYVSNDETPTTLFVLFEREFARPLSPMEIQLIGKWIDEDQHSDELVAAALREAVVSNVRNIRYIDKILYNWKQNGITSKGQVRDYTDKFREKQPHRYRKESPYQNRTERKTASNFPAYNWLEQ